MNVQTSSTNAQTHPDLGAEVVNCRRLPGGRWLRASGFVFGWLMYYVLYPTVMLPYVAMMTATLPFFALGYSVEGMLGPAYGVLFLALYQLFCWYVYVYPRGDHLVLHEKGLRL